MYRFSLQLFSSLVFIFSKYGLGSNEMNKLKQKDNNFSYLTLIHSSNDVININDVIDIKFC